MAHRRHQRAVRPCQPDHGAPAERAVPAVRLPADLCPVAQGRRRHCRGAVRRRAVPGLPAGDARLRDDHRRPAARGAFVLCVRAVVERLREGLRQRRPLAGHRPPAGGCWTAEGAAAHRLFRARGRRLRARQPLLEAASGVDPRRADLRSPARGLVRLDLHAWRRGNLGGIHAGATEHHLLRPAQREREIIGRHAAGGAGRGRVPDRARRFMAATKHRPRSSRRSPATLSSLRL